MTASLCERLREATRNGFTGPDAADRCHLLLGEALAEIVRLETERNVWRSAANSKQAKIDALMLEFCCGESPQPAGFIGER